MNDLTQTSFLTDSWFTEDDVKQEQALRQLEGKGNASLSIIRRQFSSKSRELGFSDLATEGLAESPWQQETFSPQAIADLTLWAFSQSETIQDIILAFLSDPSEARLGDTLIMLEDRGLLTEPATEPIKKLTLTEILYNALPATKDDLISLVQATSPGTRRPAATVRQFLRRQAHALTVTETSIDLR